MSQQTVLPALETKAASEVSTEKHIFPKMIPPFPVVGEIGDSNKKAIGKSIALWHALPPERKRIITLVGLSVFVSVTMSLGTTILVRMITRKLGAKRQNNTIGA